MDRSERVHVYNSLYMYIKKTESYTTEWIPSTTLARDLWSARNWFSTSVVPIRSFCFCCGHPLNVLSRSRKRALSKSVDTWRNGSLGWRTTQSHYLNYLVRLSCPDKLSGEKPHSWWYCVQNLDFNASLNSVSRAFYKAVRKRSCESSMYSPWVAF